jgi:hypothetical protein
LDKLNSHFLAIIIIIFVCPVDLPWGIGEWKRRPLELATLRLQNMIGISLQNWPELKPTDEALAQGVLTQLGGCVLFKGNDVLFKYNDDGFCDSADFEKILTVL